ncbi:MAG: VanZ family protein [Lachnospiraceae bacterium]|nr:VanZ family protein [Lachnospiraceae bacterium]
MIADQETFSVLSQKQLRICRIVFLILVILWMGMIFFFSSETAEESASLSGSVTESLARFFFRDWFTQENAAQLPERMGKLEYLIRKGAHFTEYLVLGGLLALFFSTIRMKYSLRILTNTLIGVVYAVSDEFHQSFVDGRAMQGFDILIDSLGVFFGALIFSGISAMIIVSFVRKRKKHNAELQRIS